MTNDRGSDRGTADGGVNGAPATGRLVTEAGLVPRRADDAEDARRLLETDGVCVLPVGGTDPDSATAATRAVLGDRLRAYRQPVRIGTNPTAHQPVFYDPATRTVNADRASAGPLHVDAYMAFGEKYPDFVFLLCARQADDGGDFRVVDGQRLLDAIAADPGERELTDFLWQVPVQNSSPTGVPLRRPVAGRTTGGRLSVLRHDRQRLPDGTAADRSAERLLARWLTLSQQAAAAGPRFRLQPGDFLCLDNYRVFHARDPYRGTDRLLHRVWSWTDRSFGVPGSLQLAFRPESDIVLVNADRPTPPRSPRSSPGCGRTTATR